MCHLVPAIVLDLPPRLTLLLLTVDLLVWVLMKLVEVRVTMVVLVASLPPPTQLQADLIAAAPNSALYPEYQAEDGAQSKLVELPWRLKSGGVVVVGDAVPGVGEPLVEPGALAHVDSVMVLSQISSP